MIISENDKRYNLRYKKKLDKKINIHGQSCSLIKYKEGKRCSCYNKETGYGNLEWHINNPTEPDCNEDCYLDSTVEKEDIKAFVIPADALGDKNLREIVLAAIGKITKDDYVYIGKSDTDIFNLSLDTDYLLYHGHKWKVLNPDVYKVGDIELVYVALLSLITKDSDNNE